MRKPKLYLETSIWSFYFADDAPEKKADTIKFFDGLEKGGEIYISDYVLEEVAAADETRRADLENLIQKFKPKLLPDSDEIATLASSYLTELALPAKSLLDARHAATATYHAIDVLVSWNLKHLANYSRMQKINAVNLKNGYGQPLQLLTPLEVTDDRP